MLFYHVDTWLINRETPQLSSVDLNPHSAIKRSISNAVIESANCEHIELIDCEEYESNEMRCMVTATGMPCCRCVGKLKKRRSWKFW
ncbi:hypothetical protein Ddc_16142 [Ditylenchus destructor]|nr:hypothetical protein Ddc_16142 [Ditylenchus destructor]